MMALDIADTTGETGLNIMLYWKLLMMVQVICVWVIFPMLIVYYESNESDGTVQQLNFCHSIIISIEEENQEVNAGSSTYVLDIRSDHSSYLFPAQRCNFMMFNSFK